MTMTMTMTGEKGLRTEIDDTSSLVVPCSWKGGVRTTGPLPAMRTERETASSAHPGRLELARRATGI